MNQFAKTLAVAAALGATALSAWADSTTVKKAQKVTIKSGWSAFALNVTPEETADSVFSDWPVNAVGYYNPAAFLETKQYSGTSSTEGALRTGYTVWRRGEPALSPLKYLASGVYVCFNTNSATTAAFTATLYGTPSAPAITWHPSSTNDAMNLVGFSLEGGAKTTLEQYFDGFDGKGTGWKAFRVGGGDPAKMSLSTVNGQTQFADGDAVLMTCTKVSDWSGVFNVSPRGGIDFGTSESQDTLTVRNDGTEARTFALSLGGGSVQGTTPAPQMPSGLMLRDASHATNGWFSFTSSTPFSKLLAAGESAELQIAVDRTKLTGAAGTYYAGILTVTDADLSSGFKASVPLEVTGDGGAASEQAWPKGLWLASATMDTVTHLKATDTGIDSNEVKAGGKMKVRLPLYVETDGKMNLLQRFVYGSDTNGVTHVYSGRKDSAFPVAIGNVKRVSSIVLPIEEPVIDASDGTFGSQAKFSFTVSENSKVNPFRHVFHPSHDGLGWDFETATPSGDDFQNYVSTVKPEIFSVKNTITFDWDKSTGTSWNPEETLTGTVTWELGGVRHEGTIKVKGTFTMRRISSVTIDR